ncbi:MULTISPECIES: putative bifunctional diguanylate cyclase/phosphodiesterase [Subtercola]|uniref:Phosphodiesterase n=1 Tax=Subtercola vilae TaxID=2056433 RepID=A0A4T2BEQ5_9MICO|nr:MULTISPECIES: bifunctional diguanylate cyclase/phosphodiesterase [Subtercola]MEA9986497.1 bifunctional diguanylate cyclase/phosphodiesterase [Subtercola sp. RTI3]TIH29647.1 phosphodiesterase [Subtercola vilae]
MSDSLPGWSEIRSDSAPAERLVRRAFFWPVVSVAVLILVAGVFSFSRVSSVDVFYFVALFVSSALVADFRFQIGRLAGLPSVSTSIALLVTAELHNELFPSVAAWALGFFVGALFNSRRLVAAAYASGIATIGAVIWCLVVREFDKLGFSPVLYLYLATFAYLLLVLVLEFARAKGRWSARRDFGLSSLSPRRLLVILLVVGTMALAIHFSYTTLIPTVLQEAQTHRAAVLLLAIAAVLFMLARFQQLRDLQRRLKGLTDAALGLPWKHEHGLGEILIEWARQTIMSDRLEIAAEPPGFAQIGYPVRLAPGDSSYIVATRELNGIPFNREDERALEALAHLATEAAKVTEDMAGLLLRANSDSLTGLPNYNAFRAALIKANDNRAYAAAIAVLFIDIDRFKQLNDRRGHHVGDVMLTTVADRLRDSARPHDVVARVGGDEFVVILTELHSLEEGKELAESLIRSTEAPLVVEETELRPVLSVGLAYSAHRETDANQLVVDADRSMLAVKKSRREGGPAAESTINISPHRSARINDIVADAIGKDELTLVYQPIVNMLENRIWAFEALVRYTDPELGAISPGALVERAKSLGLMDVLTRQVMAKAMTAARAIQLIEPSIATMTVNLEVGQITDDHVGLFAKDLARRYPSVSLCLELNERSLRYVTDDLRRQSQELRDAGILIALDDYGSENSSVGSLVRIPMDIIKLDRSLIDDLDDYRQREVVKALQGFSDSTDYLTIVEGIESAEAAEILVSVGVRNAQGYFYGKPETYEQVVKRIAQYGATAQVP